MLGGAGFIIKNLRAVLAPPYDSILFALPMMVGHAPWLFGFRLEGLIEVASNDCKLTTRKTARQGTNRFGYFRLMLMNRLVASNYG